MISTQLIDLPTILLKKGEDYWQRLIETDHFNNDWTMHQDTLTAAMALSDFLADSFIFYPHVLPTLLKSKAQTPTDIDYVTELHLELVDIEDVALLNRQIRQFRRTHMCLIALHDLLNAQSCQDSIDSVSRLAKALINASYQWHYDNLAKRYGYPEKHIPMLMLGMGKLGGGELNFSSDVDLIFTFPESGYTQGRKSIEHQQYFTKLAQKLIASLDQIDADGQVYRIDMRLRPFGESGPLVMSFAAIEEYYQSQGRDWERFAMLKARVINQHSDYTNELMTILKPFVFRRYLDYSVLESLRGMKALIQQEVRRRKLGNNIKLGAGGIREVEFVVQCLQMIRGGTEPELQHANLLHILEKLTQLQTLSSSEASELKHAYIYLRKVEQTIQQIADKQTQELPSSELDQARLCFVMQQNNFDEFQSKLQCFMANVGSHFNAVIGEQDDPKQALSPLSSACQDLWTLPLDISESQTLLAPFLSDELTGTVHGVLSSFKMDVSKKTTGQRGIDTLNKLMPVLIAKVIENECEDLPSCMERVLNVITAIVGRTTYLDLLNENHGALQQLIQLSTSSPWVAKKLSLYPILLDELLNPQSLYQVKQQEEYKHDLRQVLMRVEPDDLEQQMETLRQYKQTQLLRIAAEDVTGALDIMRVSDHLTYLAEAIIQQVCELAWQQMADKYGVPANTNANKMGFAVIGFGKLGGWELGYGSDLDLVFIHSHKISDDTDGQKAISCRQFYIKLAQRILHIFSVKTFSGQLYEVDMRLRPSGNSGLLVCSMKAFEQYQSQEAWTWEHQALVRARFVGGDDSLTTHFFTVRKNVLNQKREISKLKNDVKDMRLKMRQHLEKKQVEAFDIKQGQGGIADIEFIVQYLVLAQGHAHPTLCTWSDNVRIIESLKKENLLTIAQGDVLIDAYLSFRNGTHNLALQELPAIGHASSYNLHVENVKNVWNDIFS